LENAKHDIEELGGQVSELVNNIQQLGEHNEQISGIVEIISEVTDRLNLLALNAQIEAAGAGPYGKRFSVIAREVKHLADTSKKSTGHIQEIITTILKDIKHLVDSAQKGMKKTSRTMEHMGEVVNGIKSIHDEIARTHMMAQEIKVSTHQQTLAQKQLAQTIAEVDSIASKNSDLLNEQVENAITNLSDLAQYLTLILESTILRSPDENNMSPLRNS